MTTHTLASLMALDSLSPASEKEIVCGYCCDTLSHAMVRLPENAAWLTVTSNVNTAAVAYLCKAACIILTDSVKPDGELISSAAEHDIAVFSSAEDTFTVAAKLAKLLKYKI